MDKRRPIVLGALLENQAKELKDKVFLFFKDERITFHQINKRSNRVANGFLKAGVKKGDKVGIMLPNCPEFLYSWFGLAKIGAVEVPINNALKADFLRYNIDHCDAEIIVMDSQFLDRLQLIQDSLEKLKTIVVFGDYQHTDLKFDIIPFPDLLKGSDETPQVDIDEYDTEAIIYTSGTTGRPKGVMLSHGYFYNLGMGNAEARDMTSEDVVYTPLPLFHANAQGLTVMTCLVSSASVALGEKVSVSSFWDEVRSSKATQFNFIGSMLSYFLKQPETDSDTQHRVKIAFGAPIPKDLHLEAKRRFNIRFVQPYGQTENGVSNYNCYSGPDPKLKSFGKAADDWEVKVFDDDDNEVKIGDVGELVCRPKRPNVMMSGYYKMPEKTVETFRNLWLHTGDYAHMDEDGFFYFMDRKKDYLRVAGENISSMQVETTINSHPNISESAVLGLAAEGGENALILFAVLKPDMELTPEQLMDWCEDRIPKFAMPRYIEFLDSLPKTPTERVEKYKLREQGIASDTWDRVKAGYKLSG